MRKEFILCLLVLPCFFACKKQSFLTAQQSASLTVINAAPDIPSLDANFTSSPVPYYLYNQRIPYGSSFEWGVSPIDSVITIVSSTDTSGFIFRQALSLEMGNIYSLYVLSGTTKADVLLLRDTLPVYTDSMAGIRFINLSSDSHPFDINFQGNSPTQPEISALGYKQATSFKPYDAKSQIGGVYNFEIHDHTSGFLLLSFSWNFLPFKNFTIVISGLMNGSGTSGLNVFQVRNF